MERYTPRERTLVGPTSPSSDSLIDFTDVFGGPPKRSTSHDSSRYSFAESTRRNSRTEEDDEGFFPRDPWSGKREKGVFGEERERGRRKYPSENFYDDIFRGDESPVGSPRRASYNEPFGPGPGSRVMSPARPLPPRVDPFGPLLSAQVQFSLPAKLTRGTDSPSFSSVNRSQHKQKESISNDKSYIYSPSSPLYRPSPLSHQVSLTREMPSFTIKPEESKSPEPKKIAKNDVEMGNQFHFSIYKWASKGVPMLIPLRGAKYGKPKDAMKSEILLSFSENAESEKMDVQDSKRNISANNKVHHAEEIKQNKDIENMEQDRDFENISIGVISSGEKVKIQGDTRDIREIKNPKLKPLRSFIGTSEEEGKGKTKKRPEKIENTTKKATSFDINEDVSKKLNKRDEKKYSSTREEMIRGKEPQSVDPKRMFKENTVRNKAKGKVKEFVNIFSQEPNLKPKIDKEIRNQSSERGSDSIGKAYKEISAKIPLKKQNEVQGLKKIPPPVNDDIMLEKKLEESEKKDPPLKTSADDGNGNFSGQKFDEPSISDSHQEKTQVIDEDLDDLFHENFTVEEITNDEDKPVKDEDDYEDIKSADARIQKWSRGKENNIRSLLSTLQYVLWPGSGWKPVPLVDIIEGSAVKRSYQRAMLCLHPDKLQQKGAADYQKYVAAKVFDILQEAWDLFNSLGLM